MRRANPNPPTKQALVRAAQELMMLKGHGATTVDEICARAGVTKGNFFHYFKSKDELTRTALSSFGAMRMDQVLAGLAGSDAADRPPLDRVLGLVDSMAEGATAASDQPLSCLLGNLTQEMSLTDPAVREECGRQFQSFVELVQKELDAACRERKLKGVDTRSLALLWASVAQGSLLLSKALGSPEPIERGLAHYSAYLRSIFERKERPGRTRAAARKPRRRRKIASR